MASARAGQERPVLALQVLLHVPDLLSQGQEGAQAATPTSKAPERARFTADLLLRSPQRLELKLSQPSRGQLVMFLGPRGSVPRGA